MNDKFSFIEKSKYSHTSFNMKLQVSAQVNEYCSTTVIEYYSTTTVLMYNIIEYY